MSKWGRNTWAFAPSHPRRRMKNTAAEARATEILKYILKNYFSMENSYNKSNKKAIMEASCGKSHSEQINIYVTSVRFSGGADAIIFNYKAVMVHISSLSMTKHRFFITTVVSWLIHNLNIFLNQLFSVILDSHSALHCLRVTRRSQRALLRS